ncbi:MAG TPA: TonB family protein [Casimicrobiaceae bacterium]|nr:TonB family protein [Casimicrobiaceae bacterium]
MAFDPSTLCARTTAGDAELVTPSQGLSLGQRRVLNLLENPAAVDELAETNRLDPEKLARDLTRLAELRLVRLQGPTVDLSQPNDTPAASAPAPLSPVVIGRGSRRSAVMPLAVGVMAAAVAVGIWYGTRTPPAQEKAPPLATAPSSQPMSIQPVPAPPAGKSPADALPATAVVLRGNVPSPELRPEIRPGASSPVPAAAKAVAAQHVSSPSSAPAGASGTTVAPLATDKPVTNAMVAPATVPVATPSASPVAAPAASPEATATTAPAKPAASTVQAAAESAIPLQVASIAPPAVASRPSAATPLRAISRDPPEFPREAEGLKSGIVNARIQVDARGNVTSVDILGSQPPKVFDRAARRALLRWQFEPLASGQTASMDVDVKFQRD